MKENAFANVEENNFILWKVNIPINKENISKLDKASHSSCGVNIRKDFRGEELFLTDKIPENYRNQQPLGIMTIHIIIQLVTTGKCPNDLPLEQK